LIEAEADINQSRTDDGATPLFMACEKGYIDVVRLLIEAGAGIILVATADGATPFFIACQDGHIDVVKLLAY